MKYFPPELLDPPDSEAQQSTKIFDKRVLLYWRQLDRLKPRLSKAAYDFFRHVNTHDATLLRLTVGDDVRNRFPVPRGGALVNRRKIGVRLEMLHEDESRVYELAYRGLRKFVFDFPAIKAWYWPARNAIDHWNIDELTSAGKQYMRHEILFSSGTTVLLEFKAVTCRTRRFIKQSPDLDC